MRDLGGKDNIATIKDGISGTEMNLFYRTPTTTELQHYYTASITRKHGKNISNVVFARVQFALKIIAGFDDGIFAIDGKAISSNPASADFYPDWKTLLSEKAPDILDAFILMTFDNRMKTFKDEQESEGTEDAVPLSKSSNESGSDVQTT